MSNQEFLAVGLGVTGFIVLANLLVFLALPAIPYLIKRIKNKLKAS